jgi:RNA polymerase sigma factor (TIGR02999 family)
MARRVLINHARDRRAQKRGGELTRITLAEEDAAMAAREVDVIDLDRALQRLGTIDPQQERIVELRWFGGLTVEETAEVAGVSAATVKREWAAAKLWLYRELSPTAGATPSAPPSSS